MTHDNNKARRELAVFHDFTQLSGLSVVSGSIENRKPPEPDIYCEIKGEGPMAFELVEFVDEGLAKEIAHVCKHPEDSGKKAIRMGGYMPIFGDKFTKDYKSSYPIDLICYAGAGGGLPDVLISQMREYLEYIQQHGQLHPDIKRKPRPEFYLGDDQEERMRFRMDRLTELDDPATDSLKKRYQKEYRMFKSGQRPSQTTRTPNKNQFRGVWFMSLQEGEKCCKRIA